MSVSSKLEFLDDDRNKRVKDKINERDKAEHKLFGKKRNKVRVGKLFGKKGKDVGKKSASAPKMDKLGKGVSPSMAEFDKMVASASKKTKSSSMFSQKSSK